MGVDVDVDIDSDMVRTLRVQITQIWSIYAFSIRNRYYGLRYMLDIWVLGPLGIGLGSRGNIRAKSCG